MKLYHFTLVFVIVALAAMSVCENRIALSDAYSSNIGRLDIALDRACDAAALILREPGEYLNEETIRAAESGFSDSLCSFFGINAFSVEGRDLLRRIPVIAITLPEGMYVGYLAGAESVVRRIWTDMLLYSEYTPEEIIETYCFGRDLNRNMNGMSQAVELPVDDMGMFQRNAKKMGFMAFYIRYTGNVSMRPEYSFASSVSRIADSFYINLSGSGYSSQMYYHVKGCRYLNDDCMEMNSRTECAEHGAYCCPECADVLF